MQKRKLSKKLDVMKNMPKLYHKLPNKEFSNENSEVYSWISQQPELLEWVRQVAKDQNYIKYDKETGTWRGVADD